MEYSDFIYNQVSLQQPDVAESTVCMYFGGSVSAVLLARLVVVAPAVAVPLGTDPGTAVCFEETRCK